MQIMLRPVYVIWVAVHRTLHIVHPPVQFGLLIIAACAHKPIFVGGPPLEQGQVKSQAAARPASVEFF